MTNNELIFGFQEAPSGQTILKAGPFTMIYENGAIRYIRYGTDEIIRMMYLALRDKNWGTYPPVIENEKILAYRNSFSIHYTCRYEEQNKTIFSWEVGIDGDESGKINFAIRGKAMADLWKNRAGFCILHPIKDTTGQALTVTHSDGSVEEGFFPSGIAPVNPFSHIRALRWENNGNGYVLEMEGEAFEMEDQRNWTDASFKTFCTPLDIPFPALMKEGERVNQQVSFYPAQALPVSAELPAAEPLSITINEGRQLRLPLIGIGMSTETSHLSRQAAGAIKKLDPGYYSIEISLATAGWQKDLHDQIHTAEQLQIPVFISLELSDNYKEDFAAFADLIADHQKIIGYILIIGKDQPVTDQALIKWAEEKIKESFPGVLLGIGTATNFAEFNRNRRELNKTDFVSYAIHPQAHAFDNITLIENAAAQADTVENAIRFYPGKTIFISPVTLRARLNPDAHNKAERIYSNEQKADPRQISVWAAGWTLASFKYLSEAGAKGITYFQTVGKQGVCDDEGSLYPAGILLGRLLNLKQAALIKTTVNEPLQCSSLLLADDKKYLFMANHTGHTIRVKLPFPISTIQTIQPFPSSVIKMETAATDIIELTAYAVVELS